MIARGSCHCGAVRFSVELDSPVPYMRCYCSVCRKTAGSGGYAINLGGRKDSLRVTGEEHLRVYRARVDGKESPMERRFCGSCGSPLWCWDPRWPELVHPFAGAIDTPLPVAPTSNHIMQDFKADWVRPSIREGDRVFDGYPDLSLADWHKAHGLEND